MIYFHWIYLLLYVVITVPAIITVLMDNRQPAKTMAWILVFFFIPFVVSSSISSSDRYPQGTAYQRPQHGPAHQALHARVRRAGESSPARQQ